MSNFPGMADNWFDLQITDGTNIADAFAFTPMVWGLGLTIGYDLYFGKLSCLDS